MRHRKSFNHLGRTSSHRKAMLSNMATSLILHKRINTTVAKAKALRGYVEPLITKAKEDTTHSRREVFRHLQDKNAVTELFREVSLKVGDRPGGYTRIIKLGNRLGDNADMAMIELVDYNENLLKEKAAKKTKTTRRRRGAKKTTTATAAVTDTVTTEVIEEVIEEEVVADQAETAAKEKVEEKTEAKTEEEVTEEVAEEKKEEKKEVKAEPTAEVKDKEEETNPDKDREGKEDKKKEE